MTSTRLLRLRVAAFLLLALGLASGHTGRARAATGSPVAAAVEAQSSGDRTQIVPFTIQIPDAVLADLKERLARARFLMNSKAEAGPTR